MHSGIVRMVKSWFVFRMGDENDMVVVWVVI